MLTEKGVPFTQRFVDLKAKPDWFLAISPRGKVPVLVADGVPIFDSVVILQYLDGVTGAHLLPADSLMRAKHRMWIELSNDLMTGHYKIAIAPGCGDRIARGASALRAGAGRTVVRGRGDRPRRLRGRSRARAIREARSRARHRRLRGAAAGRRVVAAWSQRISERPAFRDTLIADFDERFRALLQDARTAA